MLNIAFVTGLYAGPVQRYIDPKTPSAPASLLLQQLPATFSETERRLALAFLSAHFPYEEYPYMVVRQNDMADVLLQREAIVVAATEQLIAVINDESADTLWRSYCLQKIPLGLRHNAINEDLAEVATELLMELASDDTTSFAGTALLGLYRLRNTHEIDRERVIAKCQEVVTDDRFSTANKATALQVAILFGDIAMLDHARELIRAESQFTEPQLRVSAIASIGLAGQPVDRALLKPFTTHSEMRLRNASRAAIKRLAR